MKDGWEFCGKIHSDWRHQLLSFHSLCPLSLLFPIYLTHTHTHINKTNNSTFFPFFSFPFYKFQLITNIWIQWLLPKKFHALLSLESFIHSKLFVGKFSNKQQEVENNNLKLSRSTYFQRIFFFILSTNSTYYFIKLLQVLEVLKSRAYHLYIF